MDLAGGLPTHLAERGVRSAVAGSLAGSRSICRPELQRQGWRVLGDLGSDGPSPLPNTTKDGRAPTIPNTPEGRGVLRAAPCTLGGSL